MAIGPRGKLFYYEEIVISLGAAGTATSVDVNFPSTFDTAPEVQFIGLEGSSADAVVSSITTGGFQVTIGGVTPEHAALYNKKVTYAYIAYNKQ